MIKRTFEKLGIETSLLGFGCMRFPTTPDGKINEEETEKLLTYAMDHGVNYIDTAYPYHNGESEPFVGRVLKKRERESFYLATKLPCWEVHKKEDALRIFESQLERLQVDYVDFYLLHALGRGHFRRMVELGVLDACIDLQKQGKIKNFGFSFHDDYEAFEEILSYRNWDFCQIQFNYMDTEEQAGMKGYELAKEKGVPLIVMEPVKGGSLANLPEDIETIFREKDLELSNAGWALKFVGSFDNVKVILSGMSDFSQVKDNVKIFKNFHPLDESEKKTISNVAAALKARVQNGCTGCRYCMPCPAGVDIPKNFHVWNQYHIYKNKGQLSWSWKQDFADETKAKNCVECGTCETVCPQKIEIRRDLKRVQKDLDEAMAE